MPLPSDRELIALLKALGDDVRFRIVRLVADAGELSCGEVVLRIGLSQPTVSHHLALLVDAGVLTMRASGKHHLISLREESMGAALELVRKRLAPDTRRRKVR